MKKAVSTITTVFGAATLLMAGCDSQLSPGPAPLHQNQQDVRNLNLRRDRGIHRRNQMVERYR